MGYGKEGLLAVLFLMLLFFNIFIVTALPSITINSPVNGSGYKPNDLTVPFNGTVMSSTNTTLSNFSIYANFSGSWAVNNTNTTGMSNGSYIYTTVRLQEGTYLWAFYVCDGSECSFSSNYTFAVDLTSPNVGLTASGGATGLGVTNYIYVNVTANDSSGIRNTTVFLYNLTSSSITSGRAFVSNNTSTNSQFGVNFTNLPQGYYFVNATTYDNANNSASTYTAQISSLDTVAPNISITSPANGTTIYALDRDALSVYFDSSDNVFIHNKWYWNSYNSTNSSSQSSSPMSFEYVNYFPPGDYIIRVWANDTSGNQNSSSLYITVVNSLSPSNTTSTTTTTTSSGGGGGGGGGLSTVTNSFSTSQSRFAVVEIANSSTDVTQLEITTNKTTPNASVTVTGSASSPQIDSSSKIYKSFDISLGGISDAEILNVTINFKINKSWIESNSADPLNVTLYRNTGSESSPIWGPLTTNLLSEDEQSYYYASTTPGFSVFSVIVGLSTCDSGEFRCLANNIQQCDSDNTWKTTEACEFGCSEGKCTNENGETLNKVKSLFAGNIFYYGLVFIVIIVIVLIAYFVIKRKKENKAQ